MARHYTTTNFFRQMPNALLARYFQSKGLLLDLDLASMSETKPATLVSAWLALPNEQRNPMDADFREIHELCDAGGFASIRDEAEWQFRNDSAAPGSAAAPHSDYFHAALEDIARAALEDERDAARDVVKLLSMIAANSRWIGAR